MASLDNGGDMNDNAGVRGALNGVDELVTFLGSASSNDRFAFSKRANVIFECRTCFTLFRKADGFMRHVTRCDSSRTADAESEPERRSLYGSPAPAAPNAPLMGRVSRVVPLKKPVVNGMASPQITATPVPKQEKQEEVKQPQPVIKLKVGRPPKAAKMAMLSVNTAEPVIPTATPPTNVMAGGNATNTSPARATKRAYNRKPAPVTSAKIQKTDNEEIISVSSKSAKSEADLGGEIRPSRARKTPKWLEDSAFLV